MNPTTIAAPAGSRQRSAASLDRVKMAVAEGARSTVSVQVSPEVRGRTMGLLFLVMSGCTAVGAVCLGHLHDWLETKWIFLGIAAVVLLAGGYLMSLVYRTPKTAIGEVDH